MWRSVIRLGIGNNWALLLLVAAAFILRTYGLNWDDGHLFHPDERHILMVSHNLALPATPTLESLADVESPLNPKSFVYGSLVFYLVAGATHLLALVTEFTRQLTGLLRADMDGMRYVGRFLSASFDTGTVILTYVLAARYYGRHVGLLAAYFVALSVLGIQLSHFYASDTLLTFFIAASVLCSLRIVRRPTLANSLALGLFVGLALSSKISALPILFTALAGHALHLFVLPALDEPGASEPGLETAAQSAEVLGDGGRPDDADSSRRWWRAPTRGEVIHSTLLMAATLLTLVAVFVIAQPYVIVDFEAFRHDIVGQGEMVRGIADLPYTRQYANTAPYLYFITNLAVWGLGLPLGILALGGWALSLARIPFRPRRTDLLLLSWVVPYFAITGSFHAKFLRYMLPILPFLCIFAALAAVYLVGRAGRRAWLVRAALGLVLVGTAFHALSFVNIYSAPHTAVAASRWIYENVPKGSSISTEHWEEGMPVPIVVGNTSFSAGTQDYRMRTLNLYEPDNEAKVDHIVQVVSATDYIVLFSNRLYGTIPRLPDRYPVTSEYYHLLFSGQLGFRLEAFFTSYPNLLGLSLVDDTFADPGLPTPTGLGTFAPSPVSLNLGRPDESFTVYDHPKVMVLKKHEQMPPDELRQRLMSALRTGGPSPHARLMLTPAEQAAMEVSGTFRSLFDRSDFANRFPVLVWVMAVELLGLAAIPIGYVMLPGLRDRGCLFGKTIGILLLAWLSWAPVSWGFVANDKTIVFAAAVAVVVLGLILFARRRGEMLSFLRSRLALVIGGEVVFWLAFAGFLAIRMANPDLWHPYRGGEKPMDLAYLMATLKSTSFPPYDPWFAGGYMNYYYFGYVIVASLTKLTGILPTTAFNLAVPLLFALTFAGAFSVAYSLAHRVLPRARAYVPVLSGILAALLTAVAGNLDGAIKIIDQLTGLGGGVIGNGDPHLTRITHVPLGLWQVLSGAKPLDIPPDWYWSSTRVIERTINEFPFFTFLYGDLHAHMIALPLTLLAVGVAVSLLDLSHHPDPLPEGEGGLRLPLPEGEAAMKRPLPLEGETGPWLAWMRATARGMPALLLASLVLGGLFATNSWDFPTYALLVIAALILPALMGRRSPLRVAGALARTAIVVTLSYLLYLPFHQSFRSFYTGIEPFPDKTPLDKYVVVYGLFLLVLVPFLATTAIKRSDALALFGREGRRRLSGGLYELALLAGFAAIVLWTGLPLITVLFVLSVGIIFCLSRRRPVHDQFLLVLMGLGVALSAGVEFFAIKGDVGRMNTVFKFYLQVWVLWSIASAVALPTLLDHLRIPSRRVLKAAWSVGLATVLLAALVYPVVATKARLEDRFDRRIPPTLDGTAYMRSARYADQNRTIPLSSDYQAIKWIQDNVAGSPVILEAQVPIYRWGSRISIYTGLPTVLGWDWHQKQQRGIYHGLVDRRAADVRTMYTDPSVEKRAALLKDYRVKYIYVGELERAYYSQSSLDRFGQMVEHFLEIVYDHDGVRIYRVKG